MTRQEAIAEVERVTGQHASEEQRKVLEATGGKVILACAGSGKTTIMTWSLAVDILTGAIDTRKLLCTTYSKAGASEMGIRLAQLLQKLGLSNKVEVRTMHSSYLKVLKDFGVVKNVISSGLRAQYIREACADAKVRLKDDDLELVDSLLSYQVNNLLDDKGLTQSYVYTLEDVSLEQYGKIRYGYSQRKQENGYIDFDDMQLYMYMLCCTQKNQDVLNYCHNMWQYFYIDEFQDISKIQFAILRAMVTDPQKLAVIGDDDQAIYEWRGADPSIIQNICGYFDLQRFTLSTNYRCAGEIVRHAAVGVKNNARRSEKGMVPFREGGNIRIVDTKEDLLDISQKAMDYIEYLIENRGATFSEIACLSRNNAHLGILGNMLMKHEYFVKANEGTKISKLPVFKDIKNVLILAENTTSSEVVKQSLWRLCAFMGVGNGQSIAALMRDCNCTVTQVVGWVLSHIYGYSECNDGGLNVPVRVQARVGARLQGMTDNGIGSLRRLYDALIMSDPAERFDKMLSMYEESIGFMYKTQDRQRFLHGMVKYMRGMAHEMGLSRLKSFIHLTEQSEQNQMIAPPGVGQITLSTMHGAKGREWKYVVLIADDNICFPSFDGINRMLRERVAEGDISNSIDEDRRLHYVAMTRAATELAIFAPLGKLSVFTLESLGIITKGTSAGNSHIIQMAKSDGLPEWVGKEIDAKIRAENSPYRYIEPWKSGTDSLGAGGDQGEDDGDSRSLDELVDEVYGAPQEPVEAGGRLAQPKIPFGAKQGREAAISRVEDTWGEEDDDMFGDYLDM